MADCYDFVQLLETDMAVKILMCLDDSADLMSASSVSPLWRDLVIGNGLCKQLCLKLCPQLANAARVIEPSCENEKAAYVGSSSSKALGREHRVYAALFKALTTIKESSCLAHAISASSTDNYPEESIWNTLDSRDRIGDRASYWSSKGQSNPEVPETLIYKLNTNFCAVTNIKIQPFQAYFQRGSPIYSPKAVRFHLGHPKFPDDIEKDLQQLPLQQHANEKFIWTYTSQVFPMAQDNRPQNFKLPQPILCIGGFLQIELLGRAQRQRMDNLFYICVSHVEVLGRPLTPAVDVNVLEPSGKFLVKFNHEALARTLLYNIPPCKSAFGVDEPDDWIWDIWKI